MAFSRPLVSMVLPTVLETDPLRLKWGPHVHKRGLFSHHNWQSHQWCTEKVHTDHSILRDAPEDVLLPQHSPGWPVWQWVSDVLTRGTLMDQQALGSCWCPGSCGWSVSVVPGQLRHWFYCFFHPLADLNPIKYLWDIMYCCHVTPRTGQELTDALIQVWEKIPLEIICHLISSVPRFCRECIQAYGAHTHYWAHWATVWVVLKKFDPVSDQIFPIGFSVSIPQWVKDPSFHWRSYIICF